MDVRDSLADSFPAGFTETERLHHFDVDVSLLDRLDALIGEFGGSTRAADFVQVNGREELSRVIEAVVNDENHENPHTLSEVIKFRSRYER